MSPGTGHDDSRAPGPAASGTAALDGALQRFRDVLAADGYLLDWSVTGDGRVTVRIEAGQDACADCLVPLPVMEAIMSDALSPTPYTLDRIVLPASA
jgi:hypothetical protein